MEMSLLLSGLGADRMSAEFVVRLKDTILNSQSSRPTIMLLDQFSVPFRSPLWAPMYLRATSGTLSDEQFVGWDLAKSGDEIIASHPFETHWKRIRGFTGSFGRTPENMRSCGR
nr:hypothetical protein Iba_chr12fCG6020 [Ipomoea batatas]